MVLAFGMHGNGGCVGVQTQWMGWILELGPCADCNTCPVAAPDDSSAHTRQIPGRKRLHDRSAGIYDTSVRSNDLHNACYKRRDHPLAPRLSRNRDRGDAGSWHSNHPRRDTPARHPKVPYNRYCERVSKVRLRATQHLSLDERPAHDNRIYMLLGHHVQLYIAARLRNKDHNPAGVLQCLVLRSCAAANGNNRRLHVARSSPRQIPEIHDSPRIVHLNCACAFTLAHTAGYGR